ncbi:hypothetical protein K5X82_10110 [Halosquirtibacter xylanolyticus]|uniref:hypothetical protein n=1 Tax=Halosquirtibacter xylanolyticus TaxID=3374599 RepID=UPI003747FDB9|nr:hypothetical protein K5X82_10110 [Prolixibacteraceae bacterium]
MKQLSIILMVVFLLCIQPVKAQRTKKISFSLSNGVSWVDRQAGSNHLNSIKTVPTKASYFNQFAVQLVTQKAGRLNRSVWSLSHRYNSYSTEVLDPYTNSNGDPAFQMASSHEGYSAFTMGYMRQFQLTDICQNNIYLGVGGELNYFYRQKFTMDLYQGKTTIVNTFNAINENFGINSSPTLILELGTDFKINEKSTLMTSITYRKDFSYFIKSSIPMFSAIGINLQLIGLPF